MKISYELTPEDHWQFVKHYKRRNTARPLILYPLLAGLVIFYPFVVFDCLKSLMMGSHPSVAEGLNVLGMTGMVYQVFWGYRRAAINKARKSPRLVGQHALYVGPLSLRDRSRTEALGAVWDCVEEVVQTKSHIFLTLSGSDSSLSGFVIPKRCFSNPPDAEQFFLAAHQYWQVAHIRAQSSSGPVWPPPPTSGS